MNGRFFVCNDEYYPDGSAVIDPACTGLKYGDGLFETMKYVNGEILNAEFHFERLFEGLSLLQFHIPNEFTKDFFLEKIATLCARNNHNDVTRIRLMIIRGNGSIFEPGDQRPNYVIESSQLGETRLNEDGFVVDVHPSVKKSCDSFSHLKSNNFLPYVMAGRYAKQNRLNDCIVLNCFDRIADAAIANVFAVVGNEIFTPPLSEGCVAGVMRRWMLERFSMKNYTVTEKALTITDLLNADELFLTNATYHLAWVANFRDKTYGNFVTRQIYQNILQTFYRSGC